MLVWFRDAFIRTGIRAFHRLEGAIFRKKLVLLWIDDHKSLGEKLCRLLNDRDSDGNLYRALDQPTSLFLYSGSARWVRAIILLDTDVTKLADRARAQTHIEHRLERYVSRGGMLIGSHDLIYRRVRCTELQRMFGCQTTGFRQYRTEKVHYQLTPAASAHPLRTDLSDQFDLDDGEVVLGNWAPDVNVIYATPDNDPQPLVVAREHGHGKLVWLNSGDKSDWMCPSLAVPEEPLLKLLINGIRWAAR